MAEEKKTERDLQNPEQEHPKTEREKLRRPLTVEERGAIVRRSWKMFGYGSPPTVTPKKKANTNLPPEQNKPDSE